MANTEIDSLSLNISINGLNDKDIKNLESLADSIAKLTRNLRKLELDKLQEIKIPKEVKGLSGATYEIKGVADNAQLSNFEDAFAGVEETFSGFDENAKELEGEIGEINTDLQKLYGTAKATKNELDKTLNPKKPKVNNQLSQIEKTLRRIKVISFVKLIRGAINSLIRGLGQGITNLAKFDKEFNKTMSNLTTAKTQIFNSLALIISPIITSLTPLITSLSNTLINISNIISKISASLKGMSTYTKVNTKYMEDYAKSMQKAQGFSFDTFESIDTQDNMFETANIEEETDGFGDLYTIVADLKDTFNELITFAKDFGNTIGGFIKDNLGNIKEIVAQTKEFTSVFSETGSLSQFSNLFDTLSNTIFPSIITQMGKLLSFVEKVAKSVSPLINAIFDKLLPALLELLDTVLEPINSIIGDLIFPVVAEIIDGVADILVPIVEELAVLIKKISDFIKPINDLISIIIKALGSDLSSVIKKIFELLKPIFKVITDIMEVVGNIIDAFTSLMNFDLKGFFNNFAKAIANALSGVVRLLARVLDYILNGVIELINMVIANDLVKGIVEMFGGSWEGITWRSNLADNIPSFANGGIVGEVWQMNEYGNPEMLYNSNGSSTAVITQSQLISAFEQAIFNTGLLEAIEDDKNIYIDGKYVAQSGNFKRELNRTNPNLNIK